jgi:hypothetical protein
MTSGEGGQAGKLEIREAGKLTVGCWILDAGYWMLDAGCWMLGYWRPVAGFGIIDSGCWEIKFLFDSSHSEKS